jgi:DNA-binding LacI/PurR family transcriptional regulator
MAIQLLLAYGHKKIGMVTRGSELYEKAFSEVCTEMEINESVILRVSGVYDEDAVANELSSKKDLTGLVVLGDHFSCRLINRLKDIGCKIPEDKSLVSLGGVRNEDIAVANLCRINSDFERFGIEAAKALIGNVQVYKAIIGKMELGKTLAWSKDH